MNLQYIINHVFLPPKLPQKDDSGLEKDTSLLIACEEALDAFSNYLRTSELEKCLVCKKMVQNMLRARSPSGEFLVEEVERLLEAMADGDVLSFHIRAQNAGLVIRKRKKQAIFEMFELSATAEATMSTRGRLIRCFPGPAIAISSSKLADPHFRKAIAQLLIRLDTETAKECLPTVRKAKSTVSEIRDSVHPKLVTELFVGILRGMGEPTDTTRFHKRTRDDVLWDDTLKPWRRSPLWILLRVALQSTLMVDGDNRNRLYKSFMIFLMAKLTSCYLGSSFESDTLFVMTAKISRRALKLDVDPKTPEMHYVLRIVQAAQHKLAQIWRKIEDSQSIYKPLHDWDTSACDVIADTRLSLSNFMPYYKSILSRANKIADRQEFKPKCCTRIIQQACLPTVGTNLSSEDLRLALMDFERWVREHLKSWLSPNLTSQTSCRDLAKVIQEYWSFARSIYSESSTDLSLMFLTLMDLWIALDKCAIIQYPILGKYKPGFPISLFDPLLLPQKAQMKRLQHIEQYIKQRTNTAIFSSSLVFQHINHTDSLSVRYFEESSYHQGLRREIERIAANKRTEKKKEYENTNREHDRLMGISNSSSCKCLRNNRHKLRRDSPYCSHCDYKRRAERLNIDVAEWPLPSIEIEAKSTTFELDVPIAIMKWRETTYTLLVDVFSPKYENGSSNKSNLYHLSEYGGLKQFFKSEPARLQLTSVTKPFVISHYGHQSFPGAKHNDICVENGLHYRLYDSSMGQWSTDLVGRSDIWEKCTLKLPSGLYDSLQYSLDGTDHTSNEIIAKQSKCPLNLTLHEYYSFAALRSGYRLQWRNILREIMNGSLRFDDNEAHMLIVQTTWQAGRPNNSFWRESHEDLQEEQFGISMTVALEEAIGRVEGNWQGANAVRIFVVIASRLLSMSPHITVRSRCFNFLKRARKVLLTWTRNIASLLQSEQDGQRIEDLNLRLMELALTCHCTFNVDNEYISTILSSDEAVSVLVEICTIIHDRCPATTGGLPTNLRRLLRTFEITSHALENYVRRKVLHDQDGIDNAMERMWSSYRKDSPWTGLGHPNERWLQTESGLQTVHYNTLNGSLLINGSPLARLPQEYERHRTYRRLFGNKVLQVIPSTMDGMAFEIRSEFFGQKVFFNMHDSELIIRRQSNENIFELIPDHAFRGDFPTLLIEDYVHWLDLDTKVVEWRPLTHPWTSPSQTWRLNSEHGNYYLQDGDRKLVDIRSSTSRLISKILEPLENANHIHIAVADTTHKLNIHLPRMNLDFFIEQSDRCIRSKQFRGMSICGRQSFGSLTGLTNKLVLQDIDGKCRSVLVPYGDVQFVREGQHVQVNIITSLSAKLVDYYLYVIDDQLGRLIDGGSLHSRLFRLYLHALTSYCLPDRLTGRTGTEEALRGLRGGATKSFLALKSRDEDILRLIAKLTPNRLYYPNHLEVMQQSHWLTLPPLSQHYAFNQQIMQIFDQAEKLLVFQENPSSTHLPNTCGNSALNERAAIRESAFRLHEFGAEAFTTKYDCSYNSRDNEIDKDRELNVCTISRLVETTSVNLKTRPLLDEILSWDEVICGPGQLPTLGFDPVWLSKRSETFPMYFCSLLEYFQSCSIERDKYQVMILLATLSYSSDARQGLIEALLAFVTVPTLRQLHLEREPSYTLKDGFEPIEQTLVGVIERHSQSLSNCPESRLPDLLNEDETDANKRRLNKYEASKKRNISLFAGELLAQWPCIEIRKPCTESCATYIEVDAAMLDCRNKFRSWSRNSSFKKQINHMQNILDTLNTDQALPQIFHVPSVTDNHCCGQRHFSFTNLTAQSSPPNLPDFPRFEFDAWVARKKTAGDDGTELKALLKRMSSVTSTTHERRYMKDLQESFKALDSGEEDVLNLPTEKRGLLERWLRTIRDFLDDFYRKICDSLKKGSHVIVREARMIPRMSPTSILIFLASNKVGLICQRWKLALVHYAKAITMFQRAERLLACRDSVDIINELKNSGHQNWDPAIYSDWLLMEIENNIMIREDQALIAQEMMYPTSRRNSVLQLNMGQGKSSVIVPAIAAVLADGVNIVRVIVLKPLAKQMLHILIRKLGGMLDRRVLDLPVSRSLELNVHKAEKIRTVYKECQQTGSVLLLQPEHLLSFELMGLEQHLSSDSDVSKVLMNTQNWLDDNSRDILDESDEILSVRFELIYTIGLQRAIEFSPDRWCLIQSVLDLIRIEASAVHKIYPHGLELKSVRCGAFPPIRILKPAVGDILLQLVARQICKNGIRGLNVWHLSDEDKVSLYTFLISPHLKPDVARILGSGDSYTMKSSLLLLRGLFKGILMFAFSQKRWRVNYGLDTSRSRLAVPFHAKDIPAPRAEFSHPDVTVVLTCLSYYYGGLKDEQICASFKAMLATDEAQEIYRSWVKDAVDLPIPFRHITGINLKNKVQCARDVFPALRFARSLINYYLSEIVFPAEMREFPSKLSSSGWDIAREKANPTTGFSGTNDSKYMLPHSIEQHDLPEQYSTNAGVLNCLLRSENYFIDIHENSEKCLLNVDNLLKATVKHQSKMRVVLDVGAQIIEMRNEEVALSWLSHVADTEAQAAVFFDNDNELCVITRDRRKELLQTSSFAKMLDRCFVYLDEAHTRGTDLKLPNDYRALVTLGPYLPKDRLVQACMRMRKLGKGQSVSFCCSKEVERSIRSFMGIDRQTNVIEVTDILQWSIKNTCTHTTDMIPLWATQGIRHQNRAAEFAAVSGAISTSTVESLLEPEAQTLEERYTPTDVDKDQILKGTKEIAFKYRSEQVQAIQAKCDDFQCQTRQSAALREEQERELSPENEREQQVERPAPSVPLKHKVHEDVRRFVREGVLNRSSQSFRAAFETLIKTTAYASYERNAWPDQLLVTADFASSVKSNPDQPMDSFLRPVHWILSNYPGTECVVISPYEAHVLIPLIRQSSHVMLYPYSARQSMSMPLLPQLSRCMIPFAEWLLWLKPQLARQLDLFAGQLFFGSYAEYKSFCEFLGICSGLPTNGISVEPDGFIGPESRAKMPSDLIRSCRFRTSPINFVRKIVVMRRKGLSHTNSHMGKILNGELIPRDQFQSE